MQTKTGKKKKGWIAVLIILGVFVLVLCAALIADAPSRRETAELTFGEIDFGSLKDGVYVGEYVGTKGHMRDAAVEVTVSGGKVTEIKIFKGALDAEGNPQDMGGDTTIEDLLLNAVNSRSMDVDLVTGATLTSKAHLKALENALLKAQGE